MQYILLVLSTTLLVSSYTVTNVPKNLTFENAHVDNDSTYPIVENFTEIETNQTRSARVGRSSFIYDTAPYSEDYLGERATGNARPMQLGPEAPIPNCPENNCPRDAFGGNYPQIFVFSTLLLCVGIIICLIVFFCFSFR